MTGWHAAAGIGAMGVRRVVRWTVGAAIAVLAMNPARAAGSGATLPGFGIDGYEVQFAESADAVTPLETRFRVGVEWPHLRLRPKSGTLDWSKASAMIWPLRNPTDHPIDVFVRIGDDAAASWPAHAVSGKVTLPAGSRRTLVFTFEPADPRAMGMREGPLPAGLALPRHLPPPLPMRTPDGRLDRSKVASLYLVVWGQSTAQTLRIGTPSTVDVDFGRAAYTGLIDEFGQSTRGRWPGKVGKAEELAGLSRTETARLARWHASLPASDEYGANRQAPRFRASGFFRTERDSQGRWWLVTPDGGGFFSVGVDSVSLSDGSTFVDGREFMFTALPDPDGPMKAHYGKADHRGTMGAQQGRGFDSGRFFNFLTANLQRKYGADWRSHWETTTLRRLQAWGFNTLGNWSDPALWSRGMPYTVPIVISGDFDRISDREDYWGKMPDPFDPRFAQAVDATMQVVARPRSNDRWLIGYFVDNELAWGNATSADPRLRYALAVSTLAAGPASPAKKAFTQWLRDRYRGDLAALRSAWQMDIQTDKQTAWKAAGQPPIASWEALAQPVTIPALPAEVPAGLLADLRGFTALYAETYYRVVAQSLKRHDPHHLYLGSRFAAQTDEAVAACDKWCDVVSFNIYHRDFAAARRDRFRSLRKPALVGEFNFSSTDRGPFWPGLVDVGSEAARGPAYATYLEQAARDPQMVGVHWFQYYDQPASGRLLDGENAHFGLLSVTDAPYDSFVEQARAANLRAISQRLRAPGSQRPGQRATQ